MKKTCTGCLVEKALDLYPRCSRARDGFNWRCKVCCAEQNKTWHAANREQVQKRINRWRTRNLDRWHEINDASSRRWRARNPQTVRDIKKAWAVANKEKCSAKTSARHALQCSAMPAWLNDAERAEIKAIYVQCATMTQMTGISHHVDHIVPLKGKTVCGLHVPWNLRVVTAHENQTKYCTLIAL